MTRSRKFVNLLFVVLLMSTLSVSLPQAGEVKLPATAVKIQPLETGEHAPAYALQTSTRTC